MIQVRKMFQKTIKGIDRIFKTDDYEKLIILVTGLPGTLKSSFIYNLMSTHLNNNPDSIGMYATLEQSKESLLKNTKHLNIPISEKLHIADYNRTREMYKDEAERADFLDLTERLVVSLKEEHGDRFVCFALDSLNALYTLIETDNPRERRKRMYYFFKLLRDYDLVSFLIKEVGKGTAISEENENYLADGVIELGVWETMEGKKRYIEVLKMRQNEHSMKRFIIELEEQGLAIIGPSVDDRRV
jgi:KaiC/GvpD/RAD55 family RecA-like ATPase